MRATRWRSVAVGAVALLGVQVAALAVYRTVLSRREDGRELSPVAERSSARALDVALEAAESRTVTLSTYQGRALLVHFWATWCEPCREELPSLLTLARDGEVPELAVVLVSVDDNWDVLQHFFDGAVPKEVLRDGAGQLRRAYGVAELPVSFLLSPHQSRVIRFEGAQPWGSSRARRHLMELLR